MIFDSHTHYNDDAFSEDADKILSLMKENNVGYIVNACSKLSEMPDILRLCETHKEVYGSVGIHPESAITPHNETEQVITEYAQKDKIVAIGEIGLDYYWDTVERQIQKECFDFQLSIAQKLNLPVIIHDREAHKDSMDIVKNYGGIAGVFHCFSGSKEMAREILEQGLYIAFGGALTFKNNVKTVEVAKYVPLENVVVETDCPYLSPVPFRGKRNSSLYIHYVIEKIAEIKGISAEQVEEITCNNAKKLFRIGE